MDDDKIKKLIAELDEAVPTEEAWLQQNLSDDWSSELTGNRAGYLRLGISYLQAAYADYYDSANRRDPEPREVRFRYFAERYQPDYQRKFPFALPVHLGFLSGDATLWPFWLHRRVEDRDQMPQPAPLPPTPAKSARFSILAILLIFLLVLAGLWYVTTNR
jgi:hypothetical protein